MAKLMHLAGETPRDACLAIPSYASVSLAFVYALATSIKELQARGISCGLMLLQGHCHVDDARNDLAKEVLKEGYQQLIFIDADMLWRADDLARLIAAPEDMVAGIARYKLDDESYPCRHLHTAELHANVHGHIEVEGVPTAFLKIRRYVLESVAAVSKSYLVREDDTERTPMLFERTIATDGRRFSGDYSFCHKWRAIGGSIFIDPMARLGHIGEKEFSGCYGAFLRKNAGLPLYGLELIKKGNRDMETFVGLREDYGNNFSASAVMLFACAEAAADASVIVEYGSGLSTLVMAAANPNCQINCVEHSDKYADKIEAEALLHGFRNITVIRTTIVNGWYDLPHVPGHPDLIVADGPTRDIGDRRKLFSQHLNGAAMIVDDVDASLQSVIETWTHERNRTYGMINSFAVLPATKGIQ